MFASRNKTFYVFMTFVWIHALFFFIYWNNKVSDSTSFTAQHVNATANVTTAEVEVVKDRLYFSCMKHCHKKDSDCLQWCLNSYQQLHKKSQNNTLLVVQIYKATDKLNNFLCSLSKVDETLPSKIVLWAYTKNDYEKLQQFKQNHTIYGDFEIFHDPYAFSVDANPNKNYAKTVYAIVKYRPRFFLLIMETFGFNLLFSDTDIVFYKNPFEWIPYKPPTTMSIPDLRNISLPVDTTEKQLRNALKYLHSQPPDIIFSTDARDIYAALSDPFEKYPWFNGDGDPINQIPRICAGLFLAYSTPRTILLYQELAYRVENGGNDQWSLDGLLNEFKAVLVGELPRCLPRWPGLPRMHCRPYLPVDLEYEESEWHEDWRADFVRDGSLTTDVLRIQVLDQFQMHNGALYNQARVKGQDLHSSIYGKFLKGTLEKERHPITGPEFDLKGFHCNFGDYRWNKLKMMKELGFWLLDEQGQCLK